VNRTVELVQSYRWTNVWSLRSMDTDETIQLFVDKIDPMGSWAEERARTYAEENNLDIVRDVTQSEPRQNGVPM
jgi:hypothetical protein